jgi:hypothetical protein
VEQDQPWTRMAVSAPVRDGDGGASERGTVGVGRRRACGAQPARTWASQRSRTSQRKAAGSARTIHCLDYSA